jgi:hypothetical protein
VARQRKGELPGDAEERGENGGNDARFTAQLFIGLRAEIPARHFRHTRGTHVPWIVDMCPRVK